MKPGLDIGKKHQFRYLVPDSKTVPALYPEAPEFQAMPPVFATGYMVGLLEWTCIQILDPYYEEGEGSLGTHIDVSHTAPTPVGMAITVDAEITEMDGKFVWFNVSAKDEIDQITQGRHQRAIVKWDKFNAKTAEKKARARA